MQNHFLWLLSGFGGIVMIQYVNHQEIFVPPAYRLEIYLRQRAILNGV